MTEAEWERCVDPVPMLRDVLYGCADGRKMRLFGCAACRRIWELIEDARCREAVEASERYADGLLSERTLDLLSAAAEEAFEDAAEDHDDWQMCIAGAASYSSSPSLSLSVLTAAINSIHPVAPLGTSAERIAQAELLRDIFGNPFRPVALDPAWLTSDVLALARGIYDERAFDRMPILADALQDAGCTNDDILSHCRDTSTAHVRGCWVVDLLLGKA